MRPGTSARFGRVGVLGHSPDQSQWRAARRVCRGTLSRRDAAGILPKHRLKVRTRGQGGAPTISGGEMAAPYQRIRIRDSPKRLRRRYIHRVSHGPSPAMVRRVRKNVLRAPIVHGSRRAPYGQNTIWFGLNPYSCTSISTLFTEEGDKRFFFSKSATVLKASDQWTFRSVDMQFIKVPQTAVNAGQNENQRTGNHRDRNGQSDQPHVSNGFPNSGAAQCAGQQHGQRRRWPRPPCSAPCREQLLTITSSAARASPSLARRHPVPPRHCRARAWRGTSR